MTLALIHTIMSVSTRTRELGKCTMLSKDITQLQEIYFPTKSVLNTRISIYIVVWTMAAKHLYLIARIPKIKQSVARIIYKNNKVLMARFRSEWSQTTYIKINQFKRPLTLTH